MQRAEPNRPLEQQSVMRNKEIREDASTEKLVGNDNCCSHQPRSFSTSPCKVSAQNMTSGSSPLTTFPTNDPSLYCSMSLMINIETLLRFSNELSQSCAPPNHMGPCAIKEECISGCRRVGEKRDKGGERNKICKGLLIQLIFWKSPRAVTGIVSLRLFLSCLFSPPLPAQLS